MSSGRSWSDADLSELTRVYTAAHGKPLHIDELATRLGRTHAAIACKANELGVTDIGRLMVEQRKAKHPPRKYATSAEQFAALSKFRQEWLQDHEHPRGFQGHFHSAEARGKMATFKRDELTDEEIQARSAKAIATKMARYGTAGSNVFAGENAYSRTKSGKRPDLDNRFFRSSWEANYARYLNWLIDQGEITGWEYEADTFVFHGETRGAITYRPEFKITERNGTVVYHEVKGWMDGPSKTRLRRMKKYYPEVTVIVIGEDEYKALRRWKGLIPEWEGK